MTLARGEGLSMNKSAVKVFCVAALLTGCAAGGTQVREDQVSGFKAGQTTLQQVVSALGPPQQNTVLADGTRAITYIYTKSSVRPETFIPYVGAFVGGADTASNSVTLRFDRNGLLQDYSASSATLGIGTGFEAGSPNPRNGPTEAPPVVAAAAPPTNATIAMPIAAPTAQASAAPSATIASFARPIEAKPIPATAPSITATAPPPAAIATRNPADGSSGRKLSLGLMTSTVTTASVLSARMVDPHGAVVVSVAPRSPAEQAGLKYGDVIQTFNNHRVSGMEELDQYFSETAQGIPLTLGVWRQGQVIVILFTQ
jgi:hypothetical protein